MNVMVSGAAVMMGRKLLDALAGSRRFQGRAIRSLHLVDVAAATPPADSPCAVTSTVTGVSVSIAERLDALLRVTGRRAVDLIDNVPDARISAIVEIWLQEIDTRAASRLGFRVETSRDKIIKVYRDDDFAGQPARAGSAA